MRTGPEVVAAFVAAHGVDWRDFMEWFADAGYPQEEANHYDSRALQHLENYVGDRA